MSETNLWKWLHPLCPRGHYTRIETGETGPGTPDVNYRIQAAEGWMELKDSKHPNSDTPFTEKTGLWRSQKIWIEQHVLYGAIVWIVARVGEYTYFVPGTNYAVFNGASKKRLKHMSCLILPRTVPSTAIRTIKLLLEGEDNVQSNMHIQGSPGS